MSEGKYLMSGDTKLKLLRINIMNALDFLEKQLAMKNLAGIARAERL